MNYTKKFDQVSKAAACAKFRRMANNVGRQGSVSSFECGFSTWWWGKVPESQEPIYSIFVSSTYHPAHSLDKMYKTNCKVW